MLLTMSIDGTVTRASNEPIYQGSVDVNKIILLAPYSTGTVITVHFKLPNGQYVYTYFASPTEPPIAMTELVDFPGYFDADGKRYNAWVLNVDYPLTQFSGELEIQFNATLSNGYQTSSITVNTVARGLPYLPPSIDNEAYATIMSAVEAAQAAQELAETAQANAEMAVTLSNLARDAAIGAAERAANSEIAALGYSTAASTSAAQAAQSATQAAYSYGQAYQEAMGAADSARQAQEALDEITGVIGGVYRFKGSVANYSDLPSGATVGDVYNVVNEATVGGVTYGAGTNFAWDGTAWDALGGVGGGSSVDLSNYYAKPSTTPTLNPVVPATDTDGETVYVPIDGSAGDISDNGLVRRVDGGINLPYQDESVIADDNSEAVSGQAVYAYVSSVVGDISTALTELHTYAQGLINGGVV